MNDVKRRPLWKRKHTVTPGEAALLGLAIGWACAIVSAFAPPRDFSYSLLLILILSLGPLGAISGYIFWLLCQPDWEQRFRSIATFIAFPALLVLLVAFPDFWRAVKRSMGPHMVWMFLCFIFSMVMFTVGAGLAMAHLVGHLAFSFRRCTKPGATSRRDGVWDRELDRG